MHGLGCRSVQAHERAGDNRAGCILQEQHSEAVSERDVECSTRPPAGLNTQGPRIQ